MPETCFRLTTTVSVAGDAAGYATGEVDTVGDEFVATTVAELRLGAGTGKVGGSRRRYPPK